MRENGGTFISAFAGIGGFDLGLERAGWRCAGQVEMDKFCNQVLEARFPGIPRWADIREISATISFWPQMGGDMRAVAQEEME